MCARLDFLAGKLISTCLDILNLLICIPVNGPCRVYVKKEAFFPRKIFSMNGVLPVICMIIEKHVGTQKEPLFALMTPADGWWPALMYGSLPELVI